MTSKQGRLGRVHQSQEPADDGNLEKEGLVRDKQFVCMFITSSAVFRTALTLLDTLDKSREFEFRSKLFQRQFLGNVGILCILAPLG